MTAIKFALSTLLITLASCTKTSKCENWEYEETCTPTSPRVSCPNYGVQTMKLCGDDLDDARAGREVVVYDNADAKKTRRYLRKVN